MKVPLRNEMSFAGIFLQNDIDLGLRFDLSSFSLIINTPVDAEYKIPIKPKTQNQKNIPYISQTLYLICFETRYATI